MTDNRKERHDMLREILKDENERFSKDPEAKPKFSTQKEIEYELKKRGIYVTRSTVAKDLKFINAKKDKERGFYLLPTTYNFEKEQARFSSIFKNLKVKQYDISGFIVLRTKVGDAESVASRIKKYSALKDKIIGTICSYDCILIICKDRKHVEEHLKQLL